MSKKTQHPLPTIGSKNWGSTLNNYLRGQAYTNQEIQQEIEEIYAQQSNVAQTVLSSGILSEAVESKRPGLYTGTGTIVEDGAELTFSSTSKYYYKGYGVIFGNAIISDLIGGDDGLELTLPTNFNKSVDARCVYAYYNIASSAWQLKFSTDTESSINLDPYYIGLGILIKINAKYYWHYKTMKANLSTSSKKWMMDEPHAALNTYMTYDSSASKIGVFCDQSLTGNLTVQALGINPFPSTEPGTNDLLSDIKTFTLATNNGTTTSYNFVILEPTYDSDDKVTSWTLKSDCTITNDTTSVYRLCATSVTVNGKALLLWQKAIHSLDIERSIFNDDDFNRLWYFCDPVELYRVKGSTMKATVGSGLSPINANGIDPHVTTLIKDSDEVWFGKDDDRKFRFDTTGIDDEFKVVMTVPENQGDTSMLLTNNMLAIAQPIKIQNSLSPLTAGGNSVDNYIQMYRGDSEANYHNITLATKQGGEGAYAHFTGQGYIKLGSYKGNELFNVDSGTPNASIYIKSKNRGTADDNSNIRMEAKYIDVYSEHVTNVSNDIQFHNGTAAYCAIQYSSSRPQLHLGVDASKKIIMYAGDTTGDPCIVLGGGTKLSSEGLYFPSGVDITGITIDKLEGIAGQTILKIGETTKNTNIEIVNDKTFSKKFKGNLVLATIDTEGVVNLGYYPALADCGTNHGEIYIGYNDSDGLVKMHTNNGQVLIEKNQKSVILNNNFHIETSKANNSFSTSTYNVCYYGNPSDYSTIIEKINKQSGIIPNNFTTLWRIYKFSPDYTANNLNVYRQGYQDLEVYACFGKYEQKLYTNYVFLPDLGRYTIKCEFFNDYTDRAYIGNYPSGDIKFSSSTTISMWIDETNFTNDVGGAAAKCYTMWSREADLDRPGAHFTRYIEHDRIVLQLLVDCVNVDEMAGKTNAWAYRWTIYPDYDPSQNFRIAPVCNI